MNQFAEILKSPPFCADVNCDLPTSLTSVLQYASQIIDYQNCVDLRNWKALLIEHIKKLTLRQKELLKIKKALDERGQTVEKALVNIKCTNDNIEDIGIELSDLQQLCILTEVKLDTETVLRPILDTFDRNLYGEVAATDLCKCINLAHFGIFEQGDQDAALNTIVNAKRYF